MKKVSIKFLMTAFVAVLSLGFVSCSSDDVEEATSQVVEFDLGTRGIGACSQAGAWLEENGYTPTTECVQIACDFNVDTKPIYAITTDASGETQCSEAPANYKYFVSDVQDKLGSFDPSVWATGSIKATVYKNANGAVLYLWDHVAVSTPQNSHSGGNMF